MWLSVQVGYSYRVIRNSTLLDTPYLILANKGEFNATSKLLVRILSYYYSHSTYVRMLYIAGYNTCIVTYVLW